MSRLNAFEMNTHLAHIVLGHLSYVKVGLNSQVVVKRDQVFRESVVDWWLDDCVYVLQELGYFFEVDL